MNNLAKDIQNIIYSYVYNSVYSDVVQELNESIDFDNFEEDDRKIQKYNAKSKLFTYEQQLYLKRIKNYTKENIIIALIYD